LARIYNLGAEISGELEVGAEEVMNYIRHEIPFASSGLKGASLMVFSLFAV
jgi:hypothetical protein